MKNKLAKLKYLPNKFEVVEEGDHVLCAISEKKILLDHIPLMNHLNHKLKLVSK